jgi:16S rRNA (cytidine1402-2'-O)-methyltransferase
MANTIQRITEVCDGLFSRSVDPGLYIVATPIGNLGDMTLRALAVLSGADAVFCEDTRRSQILLQHYGAGRSLRTYHEHNAARERPKILAMLDAGKSVALISDAGTPLISDPGYKLVRDARDKGHQVFSVPGACAAVAALSISGLPTDQFFFGGFLPPRQRARRKRLESYAGLEATLVFYESPARAADTIADIGEVLGAQRPVAVAREITKAFEQIITGVPADFSGARSELLAKGEIVILVGAAQARDIGEDEISRALGVALKSMSVRDAVIKVARDLKVQRKRVYDLSVRVMAEGFGKT